MSLERVERWAEREIDRLDQQLASGEITREEYNRDVREVEREARDAHDQAYFDRCEEAYRDVYGFGL